MWLATPLALLSWLWLASRGEASLIDATVATRWLVAASGIVTALPLLCFHAATRRLPLYAVGMFQYIAPTCTLLLAVLVYGEPFTTAHAICFACVWTGLAIFTGDSIIRARSAKGDTESTPG
jgi:chloramphenicol-sensitive protein RarD